MSTYDRVSSISTRAIFRACSACALALGMAACSAENQNGPVGDSPDNGAGTGGDTGGSPAAGSGGGGGSAGSPGTGGAGSGSAGTGASGSGAGTGGAPQTITPVADPVLIDECGSDNPAGLSDAEVNLLVAGGGGANGMRWLYPYDGTVFPRGLLSPLLMWEGGAADAVYVHIQSQLFEYRGCLEPTAPGQLQLPQIVWDTAGAQTGGPSDPFTFELSVISAGAVSGPISEKIIISGATMKGSVFYNSYSSALVAGGGGTSLWGGGMMGNGAILRIPPGGQAEVFLGGGNCMGCHSVSADGTRLVTEAGIPMFSAGGSFAITPTTPPNPPPLVTAPSPSFSALYPDGSMYVSTANPSGTMDMLGLCVGHNWNQVPSLLYETDTGTPIPDSGIPETVLMPMFSPDGTLLAFNDIAINNARGLAVMDFDAASRKASAYRVVYEDTQLFPGWPFFLPDNSALIFTRGDSQQFDGMGIGIAGSTIGPTSDIYSLDLKSGEVTILARAMGFNSAADAASGNTYLPFGAVELHHNYFPTVSPVAAGGYFWLFFDSMRHVGNLGIQRQLFGVAINILPPEEFAGSYGQDQSKPGFYLPGQEFGTANHRAFTALDPCREDGEPCTTGIDCCGGFCTDGVCGRPEERCAETDEACTSNDDCCDDDDYCINGFCGKVILE